MKCENIDTVGIAGVGVMGTSMAQIFARYGYKVILYNFREASLERGKRAISLNQEVQVASGELTKAQSEELMGRIIYTADLSALKETQIIVESIIEDLGTKQDFWEKVSKIVPKETILATNTSGLSITKICERVEGKGRFAGMHWFNPPHLVPLIEVIKGDETSEETAETLLELARRVGKQPVMVKKDAKGFIANRLQIAIMREAMHIVESGIADVVDVDAAMQYGLGFRYACLGPFQVADLGGLDTFYHVSQYLCPDLSDEKEVPRPLAEHFEKGEFGVKAKKGFYDYGDGKDELAIKNRDASFIKLYNALYK